MNREQWIDEVLQTAKTLNRAESNPYLHTRVRAKLEPAAAKRMPVRWVLAAVAPVLVLLALNIQLWRKPAPQKSMPGIDNVLRDYDLDETALYAVK